MNGVGGCGRPRSANDRLMLLYSFTFMNSAPNSTSADDDAKFFKMLQSVKIAPLSVMGSPSLGNEPRKKWPDARLLEFFAEM